jgi:hypothetical protein
MNRNNRASRRGLTLAEVVISTFLVSVLMLAALGSVGIAARTYRTSAVQMDGADLAGELLAEILARSYEDPQTPGAGFGLDAGESSSTNRTAFDDLDDYHGYVENTIRDRVGAPIPNYSGWTRSVVVERVSASDPNVVLSSGAPDSGLRRIRVTATKPGGRSYSVVALRAKVGGLQQPSPTTSTVVTSASARLQLGDAPSVTAGAAVVNHSVGP